MTKDDQGLKTVERRDLLRGSLSVAGLSLLNIPAWALPALAQGEELVPFTDIPETFTTTPSAEVRVLDIRRIDAPFTPIDQFYSIQHYGQPAIDAASFRLKISGLVKTPQSLSLDQLRAMPGVELIAGFECSGNGRGRVQGLVSNGRWTGVPLRAVLDRAGVRDDAHEFDGTDVVGAQEPEQRDQHGPREDEADSDTDHDRDEHGGSRYRLDDGHPRSGRSSQAMARVSG